MDVTLPHIWNPDAPSDLRSEIQLDLAFAGLNPGHASVYDGTMYQRHGGLAGYTHPGSGWVWADELGRMSIWANGTSNYVSMTPFAFGSSGTLACWAKYPTPPGSRGFLLRMTGNGGLRVFDLLASDTGVGYYCGSYNNFQENRVFIPVPTFPVQHTWTHICMHWQEGGTLTVRANGIPVASRSFSNGAWDSSDGVFELLRDSRYARDYQRGNVADLCFWHRVLSDAEILWLSRPENRMYVPDTRRTFCVRSSTPPVPKTNRRRRLLLCS